MSPIVGGAPVRGMADACLTALGIETSARAVAGLYTGLLDGWLVSEQDAATVVPDVQVLARPLLMVDAPATRALARAAFDLALSLRGAA